MKPTLRADRRLTLIMLSGLMATTIIYLTNCTNRPADGATSGNSTDSAHTAESLFKASCGSCHLDNGQSRAPALFHLATMTPRSILASLETGKMQAQGSTISKEDKISIAEFITGRKYSSEDTPLTFCNDRTAQFKEVKYAGWGGDLGGTGFISKSVASLTKERVPKLKLKWAFAFDGGTVTRAKPTVIDGHIIFGSQFGEVYCLNMKDGCVKWMFPADAVVRGGIAVSKDINNELRVYFADFGGNTFCVRANDGELIWKMSIKSDPNNAITGTPVYFDGLLYVPVTSMEVITASQDTYECCKASGQVVALDAATGSEIWRHRVVSELATERGVNSVGAKRFGPSGAPVWSSPTVDPIRKLLYIGTGENNSNPPTTSSDAIQALDLKTGKLKWNFQATSNDAYITACGGKDAANCPDPPGPDVDFGMAPVLTKRPDGKDVLVVGQKSGVMFCLEPGTGKVLWQKRIGRGGALGGVHWGVATDGKLVFVPNSDWYPFGSDSTVAANPGLFALDLMTGKVIWKTASDLASCRGKVGCHNSNSAAPTMIEGVVFAGSLDGHARAYDAKDGKVIWDFDTVRDFETINGVAGKGGAIDGPGPVIADGMVFFGSGYALFGQMPGNVLLAFSAD
jgi:polyvinyl alcohol dehydrogenase (cytochrome)